jgi:hypothetical protein
VVFPLTGSARAVFVLVVATLALACARPAHASVQATVQVPAARAAAPLPLDPAIPAAVWQPGAIPESGGFEDLTTRTIAPHPTQVWMLYDSTNLYVAFHAEQHGTPITATQTTNDVGFGTDDFVGVGIDTSGAGSNIYFFETTPRGVRYEQANENARYRPLWQSAAAIAGDSWSAVMVIPLSAMRIHAGSPQSWRINFFRSVAAPSERYTWAYDGVMQDLQVSNGWPLFTEARFWPSWTGITGVSARASLPKPHVEIFALESVGRDRKLFQQANGQFLQQHARPVGLDVTYPLTSTINFVGTLNPDFSNVEIDQQTIAPQEFRRFLQEYRPFFAQGAQFLNPNQAPVGGNEIFYSPSVGPFDRGAKIEGTFGRQSFGVLNFKGYDQTTGNTFNDTAFGYTHALQDRTFLYWADGVIAHHSIFGSDTAVEAGIKGRNLKNGFVYGIDDATEYGTWVPQGIAHSLNGFVDVHKPNYEVNLDYGDISPNYNPIDGITANSDIRGFGLFGDASGATRGIKNYQIFVNADRFLDRSGAVHQADSSIGVQATFPSGFSLNFVGPGISELRSYSVIDPASAGTTCNDPDLPRSYFTGYPGYFCGRTDTFNLFTAAFGYHDGTARPVDVSVNFGKFGFGFVGRNDNGPDYLHLYSISTSRPIGVFSLGLEYDGSFERALTTGAFDSQWLRRISLGAQLGPDENLTISLRSINGRGGFSPPGTNLAAAYHRRFRNGDELFLNFGTPAAPRTLDRFIIKYLFRFGGGAGT